MNSRVNLFSIRLQCSNNEFQICFSIRFPIAEPEHWTEITLPQHYVFDNACLVIRSGVVDIVAYSVSNLPSWTSMLSNHAVILFFPFTHVTCGMLFRRLCTCAKSTFTNVSSHQVSLSLSAALTCASRRTGSMGIRILFLTFSCSSSNCEHFVHTREMHTVM